MRTEVDLQIRNASNPNVPGFALYEGHDSASKNLQQMYIVHVYLNTQGPALLPVVIISEVPSHQ